MAVYLNPVYCSIVHSMVHRTRITPSFMPTATYHTSFMCGRYLSRRQKQAWRWPAGGSAAGCSAAGGSAAGGSAAGCSAAGGSAAGGSAARATTVPAHTAPEREKNRMLFLHSSLIFPAMEGVGKTKTAEGPSGCPPQPREVVGVGGSDCRVIEPWAPSLF